VTAADGAQARKSRAVVGDVVQPDSQSNDEVGLLLTALVKVLRETVARFEGTVSRVSEIVVAQSGKVDRDLVVTFQDFDRLQQEFATLGEVLACLAATSSRPSLWQPGVAHPGHKAIDAIPILELKQRLVRHVKGEAGELAEPQTSGEAIF